MQELAKEFFGSGQFSSADLPKLLARLGDEGLLSESQMARLQGSGLMGVDTKDNASLKEFIQGQIGLLRQQASQSPLLNALKGADSLMGNMGMMYTHRALWQPTRWQLSWTPCSREKTKLPRAQRTTATS